MEYAKFLAPFLGTTAFILICALIIYIYTRERIYTFKTLPKFDDYYVALCGERPIVDGSVLKPALVLERYESGNRKIYCINLPYKPPRIPAGARAHAYLYLGEPQMQIGDYIFTEHGVMKTEKV